MSEAIAQSLTAIALVVCFRAAPFLGYALLSARVSWGWRFACAGGLLACAALASALGGTDLLRALALIYVYLAALALCLPALARAVRAGWLARLPLALALGVLYLAVPAALSPAAGLLPAVLLGWDSWLKAFSYCVDAGDDARGPHSPDPSRAGAAFFMLVSPTLVWAERGQPLGSRALWRSGARRCALALCTFGAQDAVRYAALSNAALLPATAVTVLHGIAFYLGHSGLASLQIGGMALLGFRVPERYVYPLLATSPLDFWRRWNTWIGSWARRYLFMPLSTQLRRSLPALPAFVAQGAAALATFALIGALHDGPRIAGSLHPLAAAPSLAATAMFTGFGALVVMWAGVERALRKRRPATAAPGPLRRGLSWALFVPCLVLMSWLAQAVLSSTGTPAR